MADNNNVYDDFMDNPQAGWIVEKNGRSWYYDGNKWVLFVDPKNTGDITFDKIDPVQVDLETQKNWNPADPELERTKVIHSLDLQTLEALEGTD